MLSFLLDNILFTGDPIAYSELIFNLTDDQIIRILKYLVKETVIDYRDYIDYLRCCEQLGEYPSGLTPKDPSRAHDELIERMWWKRFEGDLGRDWTFRKMARAEEYLILTTEYPRKENPFEEEKYAVVAPQKAYDLWNESQKMHHCVSTYTSSVAEGRTRIYFLREKYNLLEPFGTIEVRENEVQQVKAKYNSRVPHDAQMFICRWAAIKHLKINTTDIVARIA